MTDPSRLNLTILSARWDDISGPSIISIFPLSVLNDPESVALQIYLASVTVFGQHATSQRTEFSVPLLSLGKGILARVAFDAWEDSSIRGKERPFFLAFLMDEETEKKLNTHFNKFIYEYLDILKEKREKFSSHDIWQKIKESHRIFTEKNEFNQPFSDLGSEYAITRALQDLTIAKNAWEEFKDRKQLWIALRIANRLENVEDNAAGDAFNLIGEIFRENNNFHEALEAFQNASKAYQRVQMLEKSGEASYLGGKCAYYLQDYDKASELFQTGIIHTKNKEIQASLNFDMGIVLHEQSKFEAANNYFERAIKMTERLDKHMAANYYSTYASKLIVQSETEKNENPTYTMSLIRRSAELRKKSSQLLQEIGENQISAASSLILAANALFSLENTEEGIKLLEEASNLFIEEKDYFSAAKSLFDGLRKSENIDHSFRLVSRASNLFSEKGKTTPKEDHLLGLILFEKAKIEVKKHQISSALVSYESALNNLKKSDFSFLELMSVQIHFANFLFRLEDFEKAARIFLEVDFSNLEKNEIIREQKEKIHANALISLRRASTAYHNAGVIYLKKEEERSAIDMFAHSVSLLIDWSEMKGPEHLIETKETIKDRITTLEFKIDLVSHIESKHKLRSMVNSLKIMLESK